MAITLSFANQKGGVGKTLTTSSVARILTLKGYKVLCVDMDPQRNLSMSAGENVAIDPRDTKTLSVLDVLEGRCSAQEAIIETPLGDMLRASTFLTKWNSSLAITPEEYKAVRDDLKQLQEFCDQRILNQAQKQAMLYRGLRNVQGNYDFILIDSNPSLTLVTLNCLYASDGVVIPALCEVTSIVAVMELINTVKSLVRYNYNRNIKILGILRTRVERRLTSFKRYTDLYSEFAGEMKTKLFDTYIRKNARAADCIDGFSNLIDWDRNGTATQDYFSFTEELLDELSEQFGIRRMQNAKE